MTYIIIGVIAYIIILVFLQRFMCFLHKCDEDIPKK